MDLENMQCRLLSKVATGDGHGENSQYFDGWKAYQEDPYHPLYNPNGVIQMGLAENQLCHDLIEEWIRNNPQASICTYQGVSHFKEVALFQDYHGLPRFRNAVARFMEKSRGGVKLDPDRIVMSGGATGAEEMIAFCLADPGDAFLVPAPYYPGFDRDMQWRTGVRLIPVNCYSSNKFKIVVSALEDAYQKATTSNIRVKGVLMANPSNPLGTVIAKETLQMILRFTNAKNLHLVCDEVYAGTVHGHTKFTSVAELVEENPTVDRGLVHILYSLSKDVGLPGFRVGILYSYNDAVVSCARKMSSFGLVSSQTQHFLSHMLSDETFVAKFVEESRKRLWVRRRLFTSGLERVGIRCLEGDAGLFCWMDLRGMMEDETVEEEGRLWRLIVTDVKLNVSPGTSFHCMEPGWFRVCFANMDDETMEEALRRIRLFVGMARVEARKKKRWEASMRLSMPRRRFEDMALMTPRLISPHSPLLHAST